MKITIVGRKCSPRESFKERVEQKLAKVERIFGPEAEAKVTATVEKSAMIVEITVLYNGLMLRAQERTGDLNESLDKCVDSLLRQIRKNKTKVERRIKQGGIEAMFADQAPVQEDSYEVVRTKEIALKPQDTEEAILQMNLLGHNFYMFRNAQTDAVNVVYKRADGGYGVLVPANK